jgi:hypothetical protein
MFVNRILCLQRRHFQRSNSKKNMVYGTHYPELTYITSPHSRVDSQHITMGGQPYARVDFSIVLTVKEN